jgi:hypothetical protein
MPTESTPVPLWELPPGTPFETESGTRAVKIAGTYPATSQPRCLSLDGGHGNDLLFENGQSEMVREITGLNPGMRGDL